MGAFRLVFVFIGLSLLACSKNNKSIEQSHNFVIEKLNYRLDSISALIHKECSNPNQDSSRTNEILTLIDIKDLSSKERLPLLEEYLSFYPTIITIHDEILQLKLENKLFTESEAFQEKLVFDLYSLHCSIQNDIKNDIQLLQEKDSLNFMYYELIAEELMNYKNFHAAIIAYERCLSLKPNFQKANVKIALAKFKLGRYREACEAWRTKGSESPGYYQKYCK